MDLAGVDQILSKLEEDADVEKDIHKFTLRLLERLKIITSANSVAFVAPVSVGLSTESLKGLPNPWLVLAIIGQSLDDQAIKYLESLDINSEIPNASLDAPQERSWRSGDRTYLSNPLLGDVGCLGMVLLTISGPCPFEVQQVMAALLKGFTEILGDRLQIHDRRSWAELKLLFDRFLIELYAVTGYSELVGCLAHDLPGIVNCPRVAVLERNSRGRWRLAAISGTPSIVHRTESVVALERFVASVGKTKKPLLCRAPQEMRFTTGADVVESGVATCESDDIESDLLVVPIPQRPPASNQDTKRLVSPENVLLFQWSKPSELQESIPRIRLLMPHLVTAFGQQRRRVWWGAGNLMSRRGGLSSNWTPLLRWASLPTLIGVLIWLTIDLEVNFDIEAKGQIEPIDQRFIFATCDGQIEDMAVQDGSHVVPGQLLLRLRSPDLEFRQTELEGEIATARKRRDGLNVAINQLDPAQRETLITSRQLAAELEGLDERLRGLAGLQELIRQQRLSLALRAPIEGTVVTWDARRNLESRPIKRGDSLLKVASISGPWRLRLWVPDKDIAHVREKNATPENQDVSYARNGLEVTFRMFSRPAETYRGTLASIGNSVQMVDGLGPVVPVDVRFDRDSVSDLQVNATALGRIHCGRRTWWRVWTRSLVEMLRLKFWFFGSILPG
jgi:multidrug efflux pump subunit AcrA (membrane-fusion protein)